MNRMNRSVDSNEGLYNNEYIVQTPIVVRNNHKLVTLKTGHSCLNYGLRDKTRFTHFMNNYFYL